MQLFVFGFVFVFVFAFVQHCQQYFHFRGMQYTEGGLVGGRAASALEGDDSVMRKMGDVIVLLLCCYYVGDVFLF